MNSLVYIGRIISVDSIPLAERIESVTTVCGEGGKWMGTVRRGQFKVGDLCQVYLPDSLLPHTEEFAFMERNHWRIRMRRFMGVPSEVLIMPQTITGVVGQDVTLEAEVTKYEKTLPANISGEVAGNFPNFIPKTDEPNFQSVPEMVSILQGKQFYATTKYDGSSGTAFRWEGRLGVCSRNWELKETEGNGFWRVTRKFLGELPEGYAVQFELCGIGIQKNPVGLFEIMPFAFQVFDIGARRYLDAEDFFRFCSDYGIPRVDIVQIGETFLFANDNELRKFADGSYPSGKSREGVVVRPMKEMRMPMTGDRLSFKILNLGYEK